MDLLKQIYNQQEVTWLAYLLIGNLICGIVASLKAKDFKLARVGEWLFNRVLPLMAGYGVAAALSYANPSLEALHTVAFATLSLTLLGYILSNIKDFGINIPDSLAGKETTLKG